MATEAYQKIQQDLETAIANRQKLDVQLQENESVQNEFSLLKETDPKIYKLIGPVLVKQDKAEAVSNVEKRLEFIKTEINRLEAQIKGWTEEARVLQAEIQSQATAVEK